jgi:hypothetical protein
VTPAETIVFICKKKKAVVPPHKKNSLETSVINYSRRILYCAYPTKQTMAETLVPIKDAPTSKTVQRTNSFGSDKDIDLHHQGEQDTLEYRVHAKDAQEGKTISLWHDISLVHIDHDTGKETEYYNFVCEIPKFTRWVGVGKN